MVFSRACFCFSKKEQQVLEEDAKQVQDTVREDAAKVGMSKQEQEAEAKAKVEAEKYAPQVVQQGEDQLREEAKKIDGDQGVKVEAKLEEKARDLASKEGVPEDILPPAQA